MIMADFTTRTYLKLIAALKEGGYSFQTFRNYLTDPGERTVILRHDVDRAPENSLRFARMQHDIGITGSYYFRIVRSSFNEEIIREIYGMGHEIGYHYEDMELARRKAKGERRKVNGEAELAALAIESFTKNLAGFRQLINIDTICMHGTPLSPIDSRILWKYYDYRDFGISGEPYFDINWKEVLYLTDTGRQWDGDRFNVRDRPAVEGSGIRPSNDNHNTFDIIDSVMSGGLPDRIMMTFHPQRWNDNPFLWVTELLSQRVKNGVKYLLIQSRTVTSGYAH